MKKEQPTHVKLLKVLWIVCLVVAIVSLISFIILLTTEDAGGPWIFIVSVLMMLSSILVFGLFSKAFEPEINKMRIKKELYMQDQTKIMAEELLATDADIKHRSIKKKTRSVKEGVKLEVCPFCGDKVDADENFCNKCGKSLTKKCPSCETTNQAKDQFCRSCGTKLE